MDPDHLPRRAPPDMRPAKPPATLIRVEALVGYGWPRCTRRERTSRTFREPRTAAQWLANLAKRPQHHRLIGVWISAPIDWQPLDPSELPNPREDEPDDREHDD